MARELRDSRGVREDDYTIALIAIFYHDLSKLVPKKLLRNLAFQNILKPSFGHSLSIQRIFQYIQEPMIAQAMRHNSTDLVIDIAEAIVTVPQLILNLVDKSDLRGERCTIKEKYTDIHKKLFGKTGYDDISEQIACGYLERVLAEKRNLYDYEFISKISREKHALFIERFDGKYAEPVGKYRDTNSNLKIAESLAGLGFTTTIIHKGDFKVHSEQSIQVLGYDSKFVKHLLPIITQKKDIIIIEGSTTKVKDVKVNIEPDAPVVLLLRTLMSGEMKVSRIKNAIFADEIWVMTDDMQRIITKGVKKYFKNNKKETQNITIPAVKVLTSGIDTDHFYSSPEIKRVYGKITYVGGMSTVKGVDILVEAFKIVKSKIPEATLHLLGDHYLWGDVDPFDLSEITKEEGVYAYGSVNANKVAFHLKTAAVSTLLTRTYETFGKSAMQARACGTQMVVSANGNLPFHVQTKDEGIVVKELSPRKVADALINIIKSGPKSSFPPKERYLDWQTTTLNFLSYYQLLQRKRLQKMLVKTKDFSL